MSNTTNIKDSSNSVENDDKDASYNLALSCLYNPITQYNLAYLYKSGEKTEKNLEQSFYWFQKAAKNGNEGAMNNLAICFVNGEGTEKNLEKAFYWSQKAAENDHTEAQYNLAALYYSEEVGKNLKK